MDVICWEQGRGRTSTGLYGSLGGRAT